MRQTRLIIIFIFNCLVFSPGNSTCNPENSYSGYPVAEEGAWCWFADPRALHYENFSGSINKSYIGYIDIHGNIKAMQYDFNTGIKEEVLVRSYFQPDDHNNPTFLVLPDERIMIFYSRHTDERCFYYRISAKKGDITTLGKEYRLETDHATTYPSPFILSNDPGHIYLCWRGIEWHPTIARLAIPDEEGKTKFNWGPRQIIRYSTDGIHPKGGSRPYAKYSSNGKDKIYMTYTTTHPDNENPNWVYFNYIHIPSSDNTSEIILTDVNNKPLSIIDQQVHIIRKSPDYLTDYPNAVVDHPDSCRNWVWEVSKDQQEQPVIAMVRINESKDTHEYFHIKWTGETWKLTFLENGGGHFHQTPGIEKCYSGGMTIDKNDPNVIYCSVPVDGIHGKIYEIKKYTVGKDGFVTNTEQITRNSSKNNIRPYMLSGSKNTFKQLTWMYGDYYDWIVSSARPLGYPTAIHCDFPVTPDPVDTERGLIAYENFEKVIKETARVHEESPICTESDYAVIRTKKLNTFSISLTPCLSIESYGGDILQTGSLIYGINKESIKPYIKIKEKIYSSSNKLANSDSWQTKERSTGGQWYEPDRFKFFNLTITYDSGVLTSYINGLIDQRLHIEELSLEELRLGGFRGQISDYRIYDRKLTQDEIKKITAINQNILTENN